MLKTEAINIKNIRNNLDLVTEQDLETNMQTDQDDNTTLNASTKRKLDKSDSLTVENKSTVAEDPKPRIVLTFRSEKPGAKSSNMKIVSNEEKSDEVSPRRSNRTRNIKWDSDDDTELISPKKSQSENDETSDSSHTTLKRSTRRRSKEFSDSVVANAIARKEKSYNETTSAPSQRLSRRIKPTAKVLANKELRIGVESQNNARLGITTDKSPEDGVRTRRSARCRSTEAHSAERQTGNKNAKRAFEAVNDDDDDEDIAPDRVKKLKHLCELGLKAINKDGTEGAEEDDIDLEDDEIREDEDDVELEDDEDIDDEKEVMRLLEGEEDTSEETSDEEFYCSADSSRNDRPRRSRRLGSLYRGTDSENRTSPIQDDDKNPPAGGDEGSEATCPDDGSVTIATCSCENSSNYYAAPQELTEPVFCQAIECVEGVRVGCSHSAWGSGLRRAGPRAPFFLPCATHAAQLTAHMCCPICGLFCTQGIFYQCSKNHLFHLECGVPCSEPRSQPGCPHCGVYSYSWQPANRDCWKVRIEMKCSNKRVFLPDQRVQCTPAYIGFSSLQGPLKQEAMIPEDLLPFPPIDIKRLCEKARGNYEQTLSETPAQELRDAIVAGETVEQLIPKIMAASARGELDKELECERGGCSAHAAARCARADALHALHALRGSAQLHRADKAARTPLLVAVTELLNKSQEKTDKPTEENNVKEQETDSEKKGEEETDKDGDSKSQKSESDINKPSDEDFVKVIKYLLAVGCDVNFPGPDGMTALHIAAQYGSEAVCAAILELSDAEVDPRDHGGWTPLVWAVENSHSSVVRLLLKQGADASATDNEGNAAIHWCALAGDSHSMLMLLEKAPGSIDALNKHADTPLHVAARQGHYACVVMLLARGAKTDIENSAGELAVEVGTERCQGTISLNMHLAMAIPDKFKRNKVLCNDISRGREPFPVACVNEVDDTPPPADFTYVTQHVMPAPVAVDNTIATMQGCECKDDCGSGSCSCCALSVRRWYVRGRLAPDFPYQEPPMLFECNETCGCDLRTCSNYVCSRLVGGSGTGGTGGSLATRARVVRAGGARGWALAAGARLSRGAPAAAYRGELLPLAAADARAHDHYMFALDVKRDLLQQCEDKTLLCVDAAKYGSAARFINHSCQPNLAPVRVFTHTRDLRLPTIMFFATKDINEGEEFTFDYGEKFWSVKSKWIKCECGTPECRYPTKSIQDTE